MSQPEVTEKLRALVTHYGIDAVQAGLSDLTSTECSSTARPATKSRKSNKPKPSAVASVQQMKLAHQKIPTLIHAAELFDQKRFLPAVADIREFCRVYNLELPNSSSRASAIPRVFSFLASMDNDAIERTVNHGAFCGPARLAPIADAIRNSAESRRKVRNKAQST